MNINYLYISFFKRFLDISLSIVILIITAPILFLSILFLIFENHSSVFFLQSRPGRGGKVFNIYKLKTMRDLFDEEGRKLSDGKRITFVGNLLRKCSIDEIPQFFNVIKGDMSLIGPRPLLVEYIPLYTKKQFRRHDVLPGITGWAQVNGRNFTKFSDRFEMDVWYVDNLSFKLDLKIFFLTLVKVFKSEGIVIDQNPSDIADFEIKK
jgi:lipopolysaccharide/colanic/teichoic acid biosynthesis glycosyltransferase